METPDPEAPWIVRDEGGDAVISGTRIMASQVAEQIAMGDTIAGIAERTRIPEAGIKAALVWAVRTGEMAPELWNDAWVTIRQVQVLAVLLRGEIGRLQPVAPDDLAWCRRLADALVRRGVGIGALGRTGMGAMGPLDPPDPWVVSSPEVRWGQPRIRSTRVTVRDVVEYEAGGMTPAQIADDLDVPLEGVRAALTWNERRQAMLDAWLEATSDEGQP